MKPLYSRPRVSDDNVDAESLFRTDETGPSSWPSASPAWMRHGPGQPNACCGAASITATAGLAMSAPSNLMPAMARTMPAAHSVTLNAGSLLGPAGEAQPAKAAPGSSAQRVDAAISCCE